jgi:hypothetical protein
MDRRNWLKQSGLGLTTLALTGGTSLFVAGCPWTSIESAISAYVPVGLAAFNGVVLLLSSVGLIPPGTSTAIGLVIAIVKAGFADLLTAINEYNAAPAASKVSFSQKISLILTDIGDNIQKFMNDISTSLATSTVGKLVVGLVSLILSTLAGFAGQLPAPAAGKHTYSVAGQAVTPKAISVKQFKQQYNQLAGAAGHPEIELH